MLVNCGFCGRKFNITPSQAANCIHSPCCSVRCAYENRKLPLATRLERRTKKTNSCWLWQGSLDKFGYGKMVVRKGFEPGVHRIAWELVKGPVPKRLFVLHKCDVPNCVNPEHLFLGTIKDNKADCVAKNRHAHGSKHGRTKLTEQEIRLILKLYRAGGILQRELALRFGIAQTGISRIVRGTSWKHVSHPST